MQMTTGVSEPLDWGYLRPSGASETNTPIPCPISLGPAGPPLRSAGAETLAC